jgi:hypothetical protein
MVCIWLVTVFLERRPAQALDHLKRNILSINWNGFSIALAHLGTGVVAYVCPQTDVLGEPTYQCFVSWTVGLEGYVLLLCVVLLVRTAAAAIVLVATRGPQAFRLLG